MDKNPHHKIYYYSIDSKVTQAQLKAINNLTEVDYSQVKQWMDKNEIYGIIHGDVNYHRRVQKSPSPPYIYYYKGNVAVLDKPIIAVVGPRKMSTYAEQVLENLFSELSHYDIVTISGMADGVDIYAHELSMKYNIPTISILGGGFGHFLRGTKRNMIKRIVDAGGLIISEYKHGFTPTERSFPQRNRLIAGISDLVFLPEASMQSGSLITADIAYKMKIDVIAPMQNIFSENGRGTNSYIVDQKIIPVDNIKKTLEKYFTRRSSAYENNNALSQQEKAIVKAICRYESAGVEKIISYTALSSSEVFTHLSTLEIKGVIYESSPGIYMKKSLH